MHILYLKPHNRNTCNRIASKRTVYATGVSLTAFEKDPRFGNKLQFSTEETYHSSGQGPVS